VAYSYTGVFGGSGSNITCQAYNSTNYYALANGIPSTSITDGCSFVGAVDVAQIGLGAQVQSLDALAPAYQPISASAAVLNRGLSASTFVPTQYIPTVDFFGNALGSSRNIGPATVRATFEIFPP
jgi:hypothetical protein